MPLAKRRNWLTRQGVLAGVLLIYLLVLKGCTMLPGFRVASLASAVLPSLWLLTASLVLWHRWHPTPALFSGGRHKAVWAGLLAGSALLLVTGLTVLSQGNQGPAWQTAAPAATTAAMILLVPAAEEIYFRGLLLDHLKSSVGSLTAAALVSLLFGLLHLPSGMSWPMTGLSLVLCLSVLVTGTVLWAVGFHLLWNVASLYYRGQSPGTTLLSLLVGLTIIITAGLWTKRRTRQVHDA
jgi:membrane protease YdiL (CAAX protease family)